MARKNGLEDHIMMDQKTKDYLKGHPEIQNTHSETLTQKMKNLPPSRSRENLVLSHMVYQNSTMEKKLNLDTVKFVRFNKELEQLRSDRRKLISEDRKKTFKI